VLEAEPLAVLRAVSIPALSTIRKRYRQDESADPGRTWLRLAVWPAARASGLDETERGACFRLILGSRRPGE
jgi:hypothetical protein